MITKSNLEFGIINVLICAWLARKVSPLKSYFHSGEGYRIFTQGLVIECNREEALRAKDMAEKKMDNKEFNAAPKRWRK